MIKSYWKQLLIALYIVAVLVLSATARANQQMDLDLDDLQKRLVIVSDNIVEPAVYADPQTSSLHAFNDIGVFSFDESTDNIVFVSSTTDRIYSVVCDDRIKSLISSEDFFVVSGFDLSMEESNSNRPPQAEKVHFEKVNRSVSSAYALYVTGVQIQR